MKITFTFWHIIGILIFISICYWLLPLFYNSWMFPEYTKYGTLTDKTSFIRFMSSIFITILLIIYLGPMNGAEYLSKKRTIKLTNPFKN